MTVETSTQATGLLILVVEDSSTQAEALRRILTRAGHQVILASDGVEGLERAIDSAPQVIVSDISMPRMDGFELCKRIRENEITQQIPVILLTALSDVWDIIRGLNVGADNYVTKPYDASLLLERIEDAYKQKPIVDQEQFTVDVDMGGQVVPITAGPRQLINLLLSTYRNAISQNKLLQLTQNQLAHLNAKLEEEVTQQSEELIQRERALATEVQHGLEEKADHLKELRDTLIESVAALAETVELRDPYTAGHQRRVADLAVAIAGEMGLTPDEIQGMKIAAIVHDIGKIRVPVEILAKPGRLDDVEMALIRLHPEAGYQILKNIQFPWPIANIVRQHHERENGKGYPLGLKHGEILVTAAIVAVADVVDAMSTHRPYRAALGLAPAIDELNKGRGVIYDPVVVDACLKVLAEKLWIPNTSA
jgi:putative nucleotidyltransferase with HDIG domain